MDFLDSGLHSAILSSLAANLASSSAHDDLGLLTASFSSVEPVTNGAINGLLSRLVSDNVDESEEPIVRYFTATDRRGADARRQTAQQANAIIAFAEYSAVSEPETGNLIRVVSMLHALPKWAIEPSVGAQGVSALYVEDRDIDDFSNRFIRLRCFRSRRLRPRLFRSYSVQTRSR